eukprot:2643701-Pleurochrysis_carterae.AAC.2
MLRAQIRASALSLRHIPLRLTTTHAIDIYVKMCTIVPLAVVAKAVKVIEIASSVSSDAITKFVMKDYYRFVV